MNKTYRVVYNESTNTYTAVAEIATARGKSSSSAVVSDTAATGRSARSFFQLSAVAGAILAILSFQTAEAAYSVNGTVNNTHPDSIAIGSGASANLATANAARATAVGGGAVAESDATAVGKSAKANGTMASAFGMGSTASNTQSVAVGYYAIASGDQASALGANAVASGSASIAIGGDDLDSVSKFNTDAAGTGGTAGTTGAAMNSGSLNVKFRDISGVNLVDMTTPGGGGNPGTQYLATRSSGQASIAIGTQAVSSGHLSTAFGTSASASGLAATALGVAAEASGQGAFAAAPGAKATGETSIALGASALANKIDTVAIGHSANATGNTSIAIGKSANVTGNQSIAIGVGNQVSGNNAGAFGDPNTVSGNNSYAFGNDNTVNTENTFVLGNNITTTVANSVVLGNKSAAVASGTSTKGTDAYASDTVAGETLNFAGGTPTGVVSVGSATETRRIQGVSAGLISADSTDAINGSQLYAVADELNRENYFHVNPNATKATATSTNNKAAVDGIGGATGGYALAAGFNAQAGGTSAVAIGKDATTDTSGAIAIGDAAAAVVSGTTLEGGSVASRGIAIGSSARSMHQDTIAMGTAARASDINAAAIGTGARAIAQDATAIGAGSVASKPKAIALSKEANADGEDSIALGYQALAKSYGTALGSKSKTEDNYALAVGYEAQAIGQQSTAVGYKAEVTKTGIAGVAVGQQASAQEDHATAMGYQAVASGEKSTAIGDTARASAVSAIAQGTEAQAIATNAIATGKSAFAVADNTIAQGTGAMAFKADSIAQGTNALSVGDSAVAIGKNSYVGSADHTPDQIRKATNDYTTTEREITELEIIRTEKLDRFDELVAERARLNRTRPRPTDRINELDAEIFALEDELVEIDTKLTTATETRNTAKAVLDAVEGAGVKGIAIGDDAKVYAENGVALGAGATVAKNATNAMALGAGASVTEGFENAVALGANSTTQTDATKENSATIGGMTYSNFAGDENIEKGDQVSVGSKGSERQIKHVAPGKISADSTDAINGSQLYAVIDQTKTYFHVNNGTNAGTGDAATNLGKVTDAAGAAAKGAVTAGINATVAGAAPDAMALGTDAKVLNNSGNAIAVGNTAKVDSAAFAVAIGMNSSVSNSVNSVAIGRNANVTGGQSQIVMGTNAKGSSSYVIAMGINANASGENALAIGNGTTSSSSSTVALGNKAAATASDAVAIGNSANANLAGSVALGQNSATSAAVATPRHAFNGITYNFAGGAPAAGDVVSVGGTTKRQIQNVAAGQISGTSTDAINGSQLYSVITESHWKLQANGAAVGDVNFGDKVNFKSTDGSVTITPVAEDGGVSTLDLQIKRGLGITLNNAGALAVANTTLDQSATTMRFSTPRGQQNSFVKADDLARHLNNVGFRLSGEPQGGTFEDLTSNTTEKELRTGDTLTMIAGPNIKINQVIKGFEFSVEGENVAYAGNKATVPTTDEGYVATVKSVAEAINHSGFTLKTSAVAGGEKVSGDDEVINPADTVDMTAGKNLTVQQGENGKITYATKNEVEFDKVTTNNLTVNPNGNVNMGGNTISNVGSGGDTDTNAANISDVKKARTVVTSNDNTVTVTKTSDGLQDTYDLSVNTSVPTTELTTNKGTVNTPVAPDSYVTAGNLATTINTAVASAKEKVEAGTNIVSVETKVDGTTGATTYTVNAKGTTASAGSDKVKVTPTDKDGNITDYAVDLSDTAKESLAKADTAVQNFKVAVNGADIQTVSDGQTVKFVNGTGTTAKAVGEAVTFDVNKAALTTDDAGNVTNNNAGDTFVTGDDVAKAINEATERTEKTTSVVKGSNTHVQSKVDGNNTEYTVSADKSTVSVSGALTKTENATTDANGAVTTDYALDLSDKTKEDIKKGVDAKDIVDNKGLTFTGDSGSTNVEKLGSTVAVNGDKNITTEAAGDAITIKLKDDITVNSVTANTTTTNNLTVKPGGRVDMGGNKITNVAAGEAPTDAVNMSQLNKAAAASKEVVAAGTNIVSVETKVDGTTGATTYTVNAKGTTASAGSDKVKVTPTDKDGNITDYAVDLSDTAKESLAKADTAVQNFKVAVNGADIQTVSDGQTVKFVNGTGTTAKAVGEAVTFDVNKAALTTDDAGNVTNNNAGDTFVTGDDVAKAINEATERTEKTTSVVKGSNTHVQSKVDGNNTEYTVSADKSTVSVSGALTKTENATTDANGAVTTDYALDLSDKTKEDIKKGVDAKDIVDNKGLTFTGDSGSTNVEKLGSTVAVNGDKNITTEAAGDAITIKLKDDITVNSVTANTTTTNNLTVKPGGRVDMGGNKITNVAAGEAPTDAVNVSQLNKAAAASKEVVAAGTNIVSVETTVDDTTGATTYTVNAKGTTASAGSDKVKVTPTDKDGNITDYAVDLSDTAKESLAKADTAVQNFKVAVNGADIQTVSDGQTVKFVNGTGTTAKAVGEAVTFDVNKAALTTDDAGNVTNNNAGDTFVTGDDVAKAINEATERTEKTTSVVKGSNTHVQSKVDGNNTEYTVSADKATVSVSDALTKTENATTDANGAVTTDYALDLSQATKDDIKKGVDAKDIVDNKGLTFTGDSGSTNVEKLGSTVAVNGDKNITTEAAGDAITIKLKDDITVNSVTANTTTTNNLTVKPGGRVDMGGNKITNVAAGEAPTDAVNVSQLNKAAAASKEVVAAGTNIVSVETTVDDTTGATTYTVNAKGTTASAGSDKVKVTPTDKDGNITDYAVDLSDTAKESLAKADTAVQNFKVAVNGADIQTVSDGQTVKFVNGTGTTAKAVGEAVTFDVNKAALTTDDAGNVTNNNAGDTFVTGDDVAKAINEATERTEKTTSVVKGSNTHVQSKVDGNNTEYTVSADKATVSVSDALTKTENATTDANGAVTTDYALDLSQATKDDIKKGVDAKDIVDNKGLTFTGDSGSTNVEKLGSTVAVNGDKNITTEAAGDAITIKLKDDITVNSVTFGDNGPKITNNGGNINVAGNDGSPTKITGVKAGEADTDAVNVSQLRTEVAASKENVVSSDNSIKVERTVNADFSTDFDVTVNVDETTITKGENGELKANTTTLVDADTDGKVDAPQGDDAKKLVNAGDIANAINNSGWKLAADGTEGNELINPSDTVTFKAGSDNLTVKRDGANITYDLAKDINVNSVTFGENGPKITNNGGNINVAGNDGSPTKITGVKAGEADTDAVNVSQLRTEVAASKENVVSSDNSIKVERTVNADFSTDFDVTVNVDETTITKGENGELKANTTTLVDADTDGKVDAPQGDDAKKLVNAGDIANAINNSGWKLAADGTEGNELINPSDTVTFKAGSDNLTVKRDGANITYDLAKDINVNSVTFGENGPKITNNGGNINVAGNDGSPTKITGVKAGEADTDAVNVSQLRTEVAASKENVVSSDNSIKVERTVNADFSTDFDVTVNVDETTITKGENGELKANTTTLVDADTDGKVDAPQGDDAKKLVNAGDIANAINNSGFKAKANGDEGELINPGDEVNFKNGDNIQVTRSGSDFTIATAKDVKFDSVTAPTVQLGDNGPKITNNGGNVNVAGNNGAPTKITGVKAGEAPTDAVNVSQLKAAQTEVEAGKNMTVTERKGNNGQTVYTVATKADLDVTSVTAGNTTLNNNGVTIAAPTVNNPQNTVSLSPIGLNNGGNTITNVAPGVNGTDAVNVNQLVGMGNQLQQNIDNVGKKAYAGVAGSIAQSSIPQVTRPGATGFGVGGGYYGGESAMAIGMSSMSDGGNWIIKGNFSTNTSGHMGVGVGGLYQW